jgi:Trypsin-co-occurring domain 1
VFGGEVPRLLELNASGGTILVEIPVADGEVSPVSKTGEVVEKIAKSMGEVLGVVAGIASGFHDAIKDAPVESAQLEFGLQFSVSGRLYVVETAAESAIKVTLAVAPNTSSG